MPGHVTLTSIKVCVYVNML